MGLKSFFGYVKAAAKTHYGTPEAAPAKKPAIDRQSPERQKLEAELLDNMRKIKKKLSENPEARLRATSYDQILDGLRRLADEAEEK